MKNRTYPIYFAFGALLLYTVFVVVPGIMGFYYSFTDWSSFSPNVNWVGLENFRTIFSSNTNYLSYIRNTLTFTVFTIILKTILGLGLALLLNATLTWGKHLHRVLLYLPVVIPMLVVGIVFK